MKRKKSPNKKYIEEVENKFKKIIAATNKIELSNRSAIKKLEKNIVEMRKEMNTHKQFLEDFLNSNRNVEECLGNVLLAIRQNEYLQAWYPEQHGFKTMKVSGMHPSKIMA